MVADFADTVDFACDAFSGAFLGVIFCEPVEDDDAVHGFDVNACRVDVGVTDEAAFHLCGDRAIADVASEALLASEHGARGKCEGGGNDDGEEESSGHG